MAWDTELRTVLRKHLEHESSVTVVVAMYRGIRAMPGLFAGNLDAEAQRDSGVALLEHTFVLPNSPFMGMFGPQMSAVYQAAANAYTDSFHYYGAPSSNDTEANADNAIKLAACRAMVHEVALSAIAYERGFGYYRQNSVTIRDQLYALKDII